MPTSVPATYPVSLDKFFVVNLPGLLIITAIVCGFCAIVMTEVWKIQADVFPYVASFITFHEFSTIGSFVLLLILLLLTALRCRMLCRIPVGIFRWVIFLNAFVWALIILISSCIMLSNVKRYPHRYHIGIASGVFGLLEMTALLGISFIFGLDVFDVRHTNFCE